MKKSLGPIAVLVGLGSHAYADDPKQKEQYDHHYDEEIIVSAPFNPSEAETALPVNLLTGERLNKEISNSIGATLQRQLGIHNTSFGTGVGQAVIRGQTGNRVQVLQNSVNNIDVSAVSPDHANGVEPILASRIEVVRGPATLLYGNGAIGGIVNVLDDRIPESLLEAPDFVIEQSHDTVNDENKTVAKFNGSVGGFTFHASGFTRSNDNVEVNGFAIDEAALEAEEALHGHGHDDHDDDHDDDHGDEHDDDHGDDHDEDHGDDHDEDGHEDEHDEEIVNSRGFIDNSDSEAYGFNFGGSFVGERGFIGFSVSELDSEYGLPPGSHNHDHDEEHDDGHDDHGDEHDDHDDDHGDDHDHEHEEGQEFVRIDLEQIRYDFRGELRFDNSFVQSVRASVNYTDYQHREIEIEPDGNAFIGTEFSNEGYEGRFTMNHAPLGGWSGIWGLQLSDTEFSAIGEEAFIPETDSNNIALFIIERLDTEHATWEFGYRHEQLELDPGGSCDSDESTSSLSGSVLFDMNEDSNLLVALSRSERAATLEERYSNVQLGNCMPSADREDWVVHAATGLLEIGNPDLDTETATNLEIGYHKHSGRLTLELNAYYNQIDDYIYLGEDGEFEETEIARYLAEDADFYGFEGQLQYRLLQNDLGELDLSMQGDIVRAEFDDAGDVPRIPPARFGLGLAWHSSNWNLELNLTEVFDQNNASVGETETDGYTLLDLYADYHVPVGNGELLFFARGSNLLDEEIRNHASFLKNYAPEPGRGFRIGLRYNY